MENKNKIRCVLLTVVQNLLHLGRIPQNILGVDTQTQDPSKACVIDGNRDILRSWIIVFWILRGDPL